MLAALFYKPNFVINVLIPVPRKLFISDRKLFISNPISQQEFFLECLNRAEIFLNFVISHLNSDQKLAESRLFLARNKHLAGSPTPDLQLSRRLCSPLDYSPC